MNDARPGGCSSAFHLPHIRLHRRRHRSDPHLTVARPDSVAFPTRITLESIAAGSSSGRESRVIGEYRTRHAASESEPGPRPTRLSERWTARMREVKGRFLSLPLPLLLSPDQSELDTATEATNFGEEHARPRPPAQRQRSFSFNLLTSPHPSPVFNTSSPVWPTSLLALDPRPFHPWESEHWRGSPQPEPPRSRSLSPQNYRIYRFPPSPEPSEDGSFALRPPPPGLRRNVDRNELRERRRVRGGSLGEFDFELERRNSDVGGNINRRSDISNELVEALGDFNAAPREEDLRVAEHAKDESVSSESTDLASPLPLDPRPLASHRRRLHRKPPPPLDELTLYATKPLPHTPERYFPDLPTLPLSPLSALSIPSTPPPSPLARLSPISPLPPSPPSSSWPSSPQFQNNTFLSQLDGNFNIRFRTSAELPRVSEDGSTSVTHEIRRESGSIASSGGGSVRGRKRGAYRSRGGDSRWSWDTFGPSG